MQVTFKRSTALLLSAGFSALACYLFVRFIAFDSNDGLNFPRTLLITLSSFWLVYGVMLSLFGLFRGGRPRVPRLPENELLNARVVILVPIYNEDPVATFARIAAMDASLCALGVQDQFHFAILSDTRSAEIAAEETVWFAHLVDERAAPQRMFYRRRAKNVGKKAGNIEEFIKCSGAAYDLALILDADSLMEGATIVEMARRMQAAPDLGLLQSLPAIINARTFFGRAMQFSASYYSPVFSRGVEALQDRQGPFWGHNAMVRITAFAASCGLPELTGKPPFGGHVLSHDYVEAALLARADWAVRLDPDLVGSYEEGPENLLEYAKRDRRWCQGNLQHSRILLAPGLHWWNRFTLFQGIMSYVASPIWLLFLLTSIAASALAPNSIYAALMRLLPYYRPESTAWAGLSLLIGIMTLLILPKILIVLRGVVSGANRPFGGSLRVMVSTMVELLFSSLLAPIMLMLQSRSVLQVLFGLDGGWPATVRSQDRLTLAESWAASYWIVLGGLAALGLALIFAPLTALWVLPVTLPMLLAPLVIALSSRAHDKAPPHYLFATTTEFAPTGVIVEQQRLVASWQGQRLLSQQTPIVPLTTKAIQHVDV